MEHIITFRCGGCGRTHRVVSDIHTLKVDEAPQRITPEIIEGVQFDPHKQPWPKEETMRYFYDSEFIDTGTTIDLISVGIVAEDGREYYVQSVEFDPANASGWVRENVLAHLKTCNEWGKWNLDKSLYSWEQCEKPDCPWRRREQIKQEIVAFLDPEKYGKPELWGWITGYDYVAFCQLFGTMMDLPAGYPHYIRDIQYLLDEKSLSDDMLPAQEEQAHHALADAKHIKRLWEFLNEINQ